MPPLRVFVTRRILPEPLAHLAALGPDRVQLSYNDSDEGLPPKELRAALADQDAVVCQLTDPIDAAAIDAAPNLRLIANVAVGYDNVDVAAASARGIPVTNTPGVLTETTADLAFALLLAAGRRVGEAERFLRAGRWQQWSIDLLAGRDIHGATLGILGMGRIGQAVARRARGFAMEVLYHNRTPCDPAIVAETGAKLVAFDELFARSEFLSVHLPLTPATTGIVSARELAALPEGAVLVNTARGPVVDQEALLDALAQGRLGAAGLDVFDSEPDLDPRFLELDNVVLLPHIGSASIATRRRMCTIAVDNVVALARGEALRHVVNLDSVS